MINNLKSLSSLIMLATFFSIASGAHFVPAYLAHSSNPYNAMNIYVTAATLDIGGGALDLVAGDEIGIFDGPVCVGAGVVDATISDSTILTIVVSAQDAQWPAGTGFTAGNTISYHAWDASEEIETTGITPAYLQGDEVFNPLGSSYMTLSARSCAFSGKTTCWDGSCAAEEECPKQGTPGCMDVDACNYNADATDDDGTCALATGCDFCATDGSGTVEDGDQNSNDICDVDDIPGCMDDKACNYNSIATANDGSCATVCDTCDDDGTVVPNGALDGVCDTCVNELVVDNDADSDGVCNTDDVCPDTVEDTVMDLTGEFMGCSQSQKDVLAIMQVSSNIPTGFTITNIFPNPFNPVTTISYGISENAAVKILIYNIVGEEIATLVNTYQIAGNHSVIWNADMHSGGMYLVKIFAGKHVNTKKLMLIK